MSSLTHRVFTAVPERLRWRLLGAQQGLHEPEVHVVREVLDGGGTALDVGAWWGPWTWWMARHADRVVVIEPVPELAAYLERVTPRSVEVVPAAASSSAGRARLWIPTAGPGSEGRSSLDIPPADAAPVDVPTVRIDDLEVDDVRLVKIDVEGHELDVVQGARGVIGRDRPVLVVELEQRFHDRPLGEVFAEIEALGYRGSFREGRRWRPVADFDVHRSQTRWEDAVAAAGYFGATRYRSRYVNNFVFRPGS